MSIVLSTENGQTLVLSKKGFNQLRTDLTTCYVPKFGSEFKKFVNSNFSDKESQDKCVKYANDHPNYHPEIFYFCLAETSNGRLTTDEISNLTEDLLYMRSTKNYGDNDQSVILSDIQRFFAIANQNREQISWKKKCRKSFTN